MSTPRFSVVVPAHNSTGVLARVLGAILASDLPRSEWELIVVDDASRDETAALAERFADRVVRLGPAAGGPAHARNQGVSVSRGTWVVFIDADVVVHSDTLSAFARVIDSDPGLVAVFGAYDDDPPATSFLSQYRNLLHRYVHLEGAGEADTFWTGCGAVQRAAFDAVGGFDAARFPRPQIEDIELGYRLRQSGGRIRLAPEVQGAHLKVWSLIGSLRTDLFDRGIPWVRLLLERGALGASANLNLKRGERLKAVATTLAAFLLVAGLVLGDWRALGAALVILAAVTLDARRQLAWFAARRGMWFALATIPLIWQYYLVSAACVAIGLTQHLAAGRPTITARIPSSLSKERSA